MAVPGGVIVVGGGKVGRYLASLLQESGSMVRVIETRPSRATELQSSGFDVVEGSGTDADVLERAGIRAGSSLVAVTGSDETNLAIASLARYEFGVERVIARVVDPRNAWIYGPELGVDAAVNQADILAHLALEELSLGGMRILLKLRRGQYDLIEEEVQPGAKVDGLLISDLRLPDRCVMVGVIRSGELESVGPDTRLQSGDHVLAVVHTDHVALLSSLLGEPEG
jgi:trk system potassium uptake protein TrkA